MMCHPDIVLPVHLPLLRLRQLLVCKVLPRFMLLLMVHHPQLQLLTSLLNNLVGQIWLFGMAGGGVSLHALPQKKTMTLWLADVELRHALTLWHPDVPPECQESLFVRLKELVKRPEDSCRTTKLGHIQTFRVLVDLFY